MVKREIEYENYDGKKVKETFYFNLTKAEIQELEFEIPGGFDGLTGKMKMDPSASDVVNAFKLILGKAYGEKLANGKIYKSEANTSAFFASDAYSELFFWMMNNPEDAMKFIEAMLPRDVANAKPEQQPNIVIV